ncbi:MAG TPA: asparagine synthase (glutamine-hydrolyzing), partial [Steroidobacteraceae bacterium]|nr:asparagine synthase (glutamine-hydrolyzing) [Steroidobacteraceae bacterium]
IFGVLQEAGQPIDRALLAAAARVQAHRGPDGSGMKIYHVARGQLALAHQRLSIIDLSDAGLQPMEYRGGAGSLSYNGELYNYLELRAELAAGGERFESQTDSEVLLAALHTWGAERALARFNWMGAFAWLDVRRAKLTLATDAGTEKPLYYYADERRFLFASEIKTLLTLANRRFALDRDVIGQYVFQGLSDASTLTYFSGVHRVEPGTILEVDLQAPLAAPRVTSVEPPGCEADVAAMSLPHFIDELRATFIDAVRLRLRSDVPVGVLLSGGLDSSSIAAVTQKLRGDAPAPRLLSAVSDDPRFDESRHIAAMERHLGQQAHKVILRIAPERLIAELNEVIWYNDAPPGGLSAVAHFNLMAKARELGLTVILSGQGADELLLGYRKFLGFYLQSLVRRGRILRATGVLGACLANGTFAGQFDIGDAKRYVGFLRRFASLRSGQSEFAIEGEALRGWAAENLGLGDGTLVERQRRDLLKLSVPSLCHYEDRMSMANSREIRLPFLDSRLIDLLMRAPDSYKLRRGWTKYALRAAMRDLLPPQITWRKDKQGFSNPEGEWLKHELEPVVRDAFASTSAMSGKGLIDSVALLRKYEQYRLQPPGKGTIWYREIFAPLALELWLRRFERWIQ